MRLAVVFVAVLAISAAYAQKPEREHKVIDILTEAGQKLRDVWEEFKAERTTNKRNLLATGPKSFQSFMGNLMGKNWTDFAPPSWSNPSFTWDKLGTFEYSSNMQDFLDKAKMDNFTLPQSIGDIHKAMDDVSSHFCTPEKYSPSQKVFATCVGPAVSLAYVPKVCVLDKATHEVVCDPAKLVLTKSPGGCTHKYHSPSAWVGKDCKISGEVGFTKSSVQGGAAYQIPLKTIEVGYEP